VPGVFISYRKEDARAWAIALRDALADTFGERRIFFDVDSMGAGNWRAQIDRALENSSVVLVVIGPRWIAVADAEGRKRLMLPDDVHRIEIASALRRTGITVIPVLVDGARLPASADLPDDLRGLLERQANEIGDARERRVSDIRRLTRAIDEVLGQRGQQLRAAAAAAAIVAVGIVNARVSSNSPLAAIMFLVFAAVIGACSWQIYRRMASDHVKGAWVALVALILSVATLVGSIARLAASYGRPVQTSWSRDA
jgi:hypothetical protein